MAVSVKSKRKIKSVGVAESSTESNTTKAPALNWDSPTNILDTIEQSRDLIRTRAYFLWLENKNLEPQQCWLAAEREFVTQS